MEQTKRCHQRHPSWIGRARTRMRSSRGTTIVEAAFVTPIFLMLIMALFEGGMYMKDNLAVANTVRAGARAASASGAYEKADLYTVLNMGRESAALKRSEIDYVVIYKPSINPLAAGAPPSATCQAGTSVTGLCNVFRPVDFDRAEAQVAEESAQKEAEKQAEITGIPATRTLNKNLIWFGCLKNVGTVTWPHAGDSPDRFWCPQDRKDARSDNGKAGPDFVGVWMKIDHSWLTKMFGTSRKITDQSVIRIEPRSA